MQGLIVIDKPAGFTSHDVVNRVRRVLRTKRVGHTGTLDPFATGVMVILVGSATRLAQFLDKDEKEYEAVIQFGAETDTGDVTGMQTAECGLTDQELATRVAAIDWEKVLLSFRGEIMQVPPMYSAKKIGGRKLYEFARKGKEVERDAVPITIKALELLEAGEAGALRSAIRVRVVCSAGTYIRTLAADIGRAVGLGAHLTLLRRTRAGRFGIDGAVSLDELEKAVEPRDFLRKIDQAVDHLTEIRLNADRADKTLSGLSSRIQRPDLLDGMLVRITDPTGKLLAIGRYIDEEKSVRPKIVLG
ncbi:MAG TPA: tRNA pseudouridine(55) synthase TruB [Pyrinomonadaceae bacterium]|nr:tRNA pseudouridine(55) synthase TruB [Pyrinomonadaceae bacterium]